MLSGAAPAYAASGPGTSNAAVVSRLSFFSTTDLDFGTILASAAGGTVTVAPDGTRTSSGVTTVGGGQVPAAFVGRGTFNQIVTISMLATPITLTKVGGTQTMQVGTFVIGSAPTTVILTTTPQRFRIGSATGVFGFNLGATLTVNPNQVDGNYVGTFSIILNYQ
jgi:hypothetical protein